MLSKLLLTAFLIMAPGGLMEVSAQGNEETSRVVLKGANNIFPGDKPIEGEAIGLPSALKMCMLFLGDGRGYTDLKHGEYESIMDRTYIFAMGATGEAFRFWDSLYSYKSADVEKLFKNSLDAAGYSYNLVMPSAYAEKIGFKGNCYKDTAELAKLIDDHIRKVGKPVVLIEAGKWPDWRLITGSDKNGSVLIGFGGALDGNGYPPGSGQNPEKQFNLSDLVDEHGPWVVLIRDKSKAPDAADFYRKSLVYGLTVLQDVNKSGYDSWVRLLKDDSKYPETDSVLKERLEDNRVIASELIERRFYAALFVNQAAAYLPAAKEDLIDAQRRFDAVWGFVYDQMFPLVDGFQGEGYKKLADPKVREKMIEVIEEARAQDKKAADSIKKALDK